MKNVSIQKEGVGEFIFDGNSTVLSSVKFGYPKISRSTVEKNGTFGVEIAETYAGISEVCIEGYILDRDVPVEFSHRLISQIIGTGDIFTLAIGEFSRIMNAESLEFSPDVGFASGYCERFRLKAVSADLFTRGEKSVYGVPNTSGNISFPVSFGRKFGEVSSHGKITVFNEGDSEVGFVLNAEFPAASSGFVLTSSRESGNFAVAQSIAQGTKIKIDTRSGKKGIWNGSGTSILGNIDTNCKFFTLKPGETVISWRNVSAKAPNLTVTFDEGFVTAPVAFTSEVEE